jgi:hypothetical protein
MVIALSKGISPLTFTQETWGNLSVVVSIVFVAAICFRVYKKQIVDRYLLGMFLFVLIGSIGYLGNIPSILYYYTNYWLVILFACLTFVGIVTFFTPAGSIGVESDDKNKIQTISLKLLAFLLVQLLSSLWLNDYLNNKLTLQLFIMYFVGRAYERLGDEARGKKPKRSTWKFKWKY